MTNAKLLQMIEQAAKHQVTSLDLSEKGLTILPTEISQLTHLTELDLSDNQLTELPPEIGHLTSLIMLKVSGNQLTELPPTISQLSNIKKLILGDVFGGNHLTVLPGVVKIPKKPHLKSKNQVNFLFRLSLLD